MSLTLKIDHGDEVSVPADIFKGALPMAEIGAVALMLALAEGRLTFEHERFQAADTIAAMKGLKEKGVLNISTEPGSVKINIDLNKAIAAGAEFQD